MPKPSRSGRPADSQGCMMTMTPAKPMTTAVSLRGDRRSLGSRANAKKTAANGVVALPIPARAEETRTSPAANRLNGRAVRNTPDTARWAQVRRSRGNLPPVMAKRANSVAVPAKIRSPEICRGAIVRSPTFISRKLDPQMKARRTYLACQGTRVTRVGVALGVVATVLLIGASTLGSFGPFRGHGDRCTLNAPGPLWCESGQPAGRAGGEVGQGLRGHPRVVPAPRHDIGGRPHGAAAIGREAPGIQGDTVLDGGGDGLPALGGERGDVERDGADAGGAEQ